MKNISIIKVTREQEVVISKTCNKCKCTYEPDRDDEYHDIHSATFSFDGERSKYYSRCWMFDICDTCMIEFVKTFKLAPDYFMALVKETRKDLKSLKAKNKNYIMK